MCEKQINLKKINCVRKKFMPKKFFRLTVSNFAYIVKLTRKEFFMTIITGTTM